MENNTDHELNILTSEYSNKLCENMEETNLNIQDTLNIPENSICSNDVHIINVIQVEQFCRICGAVKELSDMIHIYGDKGNELNLQKKIITHLQLKITKDDRLPQQVCTTCVSHLNICHSLFEVSQSADNKLRQLFLFDEVSENNESCVVVPVDIISDLDGMDHQEEGPVVSKPVPENNEQSLEIKCDLEGRDKKEEVDLNKAASEEDKTSSTESLLCDICGKSFKLLSKLQIHKRTHLDDTTKKKHQCSLCPKSFRSKFHLSEHVNVHNGTTPYNCPECGKAFHKRAQLRQHAQIHIHDSKKSVCEVCGIRFSRKSNLQAHAKTHVEGRTFPCKLCHMQFSSFSAMLCHRKQHSQDDIKTRIKLGLFKEKNGLFFICEVCGLVLTNRDSFMTHLARHKQQQRLQCPDCGKQLRSQRSLKYHYRSMHTGERPFHCSFCPEGFMTRKLKEAHERSHTGEKPFICEVCCKGFKSRNNLSQHMLKHNGVKKFECSFCEKMFFRKGALTVHTRKHTGEKPFICDICGRAFNQKNDMLKHQKNHIDLTSRTNTCELCFAVFTSSSELASHKEQVHKNHSDIVPLIITSNNVFETLIITEDGQKLVVTTEAISSDPLATVSTSTS